MFFMTHIRLNILFNTYFNVTLLFYELSSQTDAHIFEHAPENTRAHSPTYNHNTQRKVLFTLFILFFLFYNIYE